MQQIFLTEMAPEKYCQLGKQFPFPSPEACLNPACLVPAPPKKHGFYERNVISFAFSGRILVRRYYCPYCKKTISYLPSFCLPYFQYALELIFLGLLCIFHLDCSVATCLRILRMVQDALAWQRQHLRYYTRRFLAGWKRLQLGLRLLIPDLVLPGDEPGKKGARKLLAIVTSGFAEIQAFSQRFFAQCGQSFMTPCKLL